MNANVHLRLWPLLRRLNHWSGHPAVEKLLCCLCAAGAGLLLAGLKISGSWFPLPLALAAALGLRLESFAAYVGGCLGYLAFHGSACAMEPAAVGLLVEACLCIFGDQIPKKNLWVQPSIVMVFMALVGLLFLLEQRFSARLVWRCLLRIAAGGGSTLCFLLALDHGSRMCRMILCAMACGSLCAVAPAGLPLGLVAACALSAAALETDQPVTVAALCGLAADLCLGSCATAVLALGALAGCGRLRAVRLALWGGAVTVGSVLTGDGELLLAAAMLGLPLSLAVPADKFFGGQGGLPTEDRRMAVTAELLDQLGHCLAPVRRGRADPDTAAVFDQAAERVCRMCSRWDDCWDENAMVTVDALERAAPAMMTRGRALREDLPQLFVDRCCHLEGFLTAVNRELEDLSCRRQCRSRIRESRAILASQYTILARAMSGPGPDRGGECRYLPEVGFRSEGRMEDTVSGDRGATFRIGRYFHLILCDGMGTGPGAAAEAGAAIGILRTLLQSGAGPEEAMEFLNGIYILREDGGFATVDLLQADLSTGEARLLKWGAAPSYLKNRQQVERIGEAGPPPGIGVGEDFRPEVKTFSLARGELLVLTTDGAGGEAAERFLRQYGGLSPKELASGIVSCSQCPNEDDRTAAVVTLRPRALASC